METNIQVLLKMDFPMEWVFSLSLMAQDMKVNSRLDSNMEKVYHLIRQEIAVLVCGRMVSVKLGLRILKREKCQSHKQKLQ